MLDRFRWYASTTCDAAETSLAARRQDPEGLDALIDVADQVLRTWQPQWSCFVSAPLREDAVQRLAVLTELQIHADGGRPEAERQRLLISRCEGGTAPQEEHPLPVMGLEVEGNFLFDPVDPHDMRAAILELGIEAGHLGDLWIRCDRGARLLCSPEAAAALHGRSGRVRDVDIRLEERPVASLQLPQSRVPKRFASVEASCRLDAIASSGLWPLPGEGGGSDPQRAFAPQLAIRSPSQQRSESRRSTAAAGSRQRRGAGSRTHQKDRWRVQMERR